MNRWNPGFAIIIENRPVTVTINIFWFSSIFLFYLFYCENTAYHSLPQSIPSIYKLQMQIMCDICSCSWVRWRQKVTCKQNKVNKKQSQLLHEPNKSHGTLKWRVDETAALCVNHGKRSLLPCVCNSSESSSNQRSEATELGHSSLVMNAHELQQ